MDNGQTHFSLYVADWDTAIIKACVAVQENYIMVKLKGADIDPVEYKNVTTFYGRGKAKNKGFIGDMNAVLGTDYSADDFDIEERVRFIPDIEDPLEEAFMHFNTSVGYLKNGPVTFDDYRLVIGGETENSRKAIAQELPYKGERKEKPLIFAELMEKVLDQYHNKVILAEGVEADDVISKLGMENFLHFRKTGEWLYCFDYIDKDLDMIVSPSTLGSKRENGIRYRTVHDAAKAYAIQLLTGDLTVDNIPGIEAFSDEFREKYGINKTNGIGKATAEKLLGGCENPKEMFERVVEAYKTYYGPRKKDKFISCHGEELSWTWKDKLRNRASLLWMHRNEEFDYDIFTDTFDKLGVKY